MSSLGDGASRLHPIPLLTIWNRPRVPRHSRVPLATEETACETPK